MKLPQKLKIGPYWYKVLFPYYFKERYDYYGQHDRQLLEIRVADRDSNGNIRKDAIVLGTFIHEILHALDINANYQIFAKEGLDTESRIDILTQGLMGLLVDNGFLKILKVIFKVLNGRKGNALDGNEF